MARVRIERLVGVEHAVVGLAIDDAPGAERPGDIAVLVKLHRPDHADIAQMAGRPLAGIIRDLFDAIDADKVEADAKAEIEAASSIVAEPAK